LTVKGVGADIGIAFDGDGDRVMMVDHQGNLVDGDQLLYVLATDRRARRELVGPIVGTLMSNLGLEQALVAQGLAFHRAKVGDRYVLEMLRACGGQLGGETSGHILCLDKATTGDGLITALQVLRVVKESGRSLAELTRGMKRLPQVLINVRTRNRVDFEAAPPVRQAVVDVEQALRDRGRVVLRSSGTEPVVRVMVEGEDAAEVRRFAEHIARAVEQVAAS
jgi:phosphoglucosamine mutase